MKYKIMAFFSGRNGMDDLAKIIFWPSLVLMLVSSFVGVQWLGQLLYWLSFAMLIYSYFRMFSRNLAKRQAENAKYVSWRSFQKSRFQQRKTHRFYTCPKCRAHLRVHRGKGKISITCRTCGEKFIKKT